MQVNVQAFLYSSAFIDWAFGWNLPSKKSIMQKVYNEWTDGWIGRKTHFCFDADSSIGLSSSRFSPTPDKSGSSPTMSWSSLLMSSCRAATFSRCFLDLSWLTNLRNQQSLFCQHWKSTAIHSGKFLHLLSHCRPRFLWLSQIAKTYCLDL